MVNFEWYRTFVAIYQCGNLTKASQELSISQPNASVHLASLEQYVGNKLFDRLPRKMIPTNHGKKLYTQIVASVENLSSVERSFRKNSSNNIYTLRLGCPIEFFYTRLAGRIAGLPFHLDVTFGTAKELVQQMIDGELDFVIASKKAIENRQIVYEPILTENFIIVGNYGLEIEELQKYIDVKDNDGIENWLLDQDWYAYSSDLAFIRRFWLKNFNKRPMIDPSNVIPNLNVILKAIEGGGGISVVSDYLAEDFINKGTVKTIWNGNNETSNTLFLAYDKSKVSIDKIEEVRRWVMMD
ncbi:LysR family transcriptional regulator [Empedobacter brevis]|uniref:LysR family transcriptional regulator n=1 Tax=Empedobacter brevis TaxID=247 RepID=A0AAJ1QER2_9FLAO|nr:LysR family transcriptional regulator [Empedobacter brevis]MDM1072566.1 LysR family transcriptional regulator [Empedobacter brevis]